MQREMGGSKIDCKMKNCRREIVSDQMIALWYLHSIDINISIKSQRRVYNCGTCGRPRVVMCPVGMERVSAVVCL